MNEQFEIWYRLNHSILHVCRTREQILEEEVRHANCENAWNAALKFAQQPTGENCPHLRNERW